MGTHCDHCRDLSEFKELFRNACSQARYVRIDIAAQNNYLCNKCNDPHHQRELMYKSIIAFSNE